MTMKKTFQGGCHCGAVRFECELDPANGSSRCNCSICAKSRFWKAIAKGDAFRVLKGADALIVYGFGRGAIEHHFCRTCGIKPFGRGDMEVMGGVFYGVNLACLDGPAPEVFAAGAISYEDGRHDDWSKAPAETRHL
jgi:hypothetical protein